MEKVLAFAGGTLILLTLVTGNGLLAQLVERLNGIEEVSGSNPLGSTSFHFPRQEIVRQAVEGDFPS
jgi:hypothetical protein